MAALGTLLAGDSGAAVLHLGFLPVGAIGTAMLWAAALLTLVTGWDDLIAGIRHVSPASAWPAWHGRHTEDPRTGRMVGKRQDNAYERADPLLRAAALRVSTVKHAHHGLDLDLPGKDSFRHREAGAAEVLVVGGQRWALLHETPDAPAALEDLLGRLAPVDLVLVEGFKDYAFSKIAVHRPALAKPPIWPARQGIVAVATDAPVLDSCPHPLLPINDPPVIARWIAAFAASGP